MTHHSKITAKGQTTVPAEIRAALCVGPKDFLSYDLQPDGSVIVRKVPPLSSFAGIFKTDIQLTDEELRQAIEDAREAMAMGHDRP